MLLFFALSCLAAAAVGSAVVYQRGAQNRLADGNGTAGAARLPAAAPAPTAPTAHGPARGEPTLETLQHGDVVVDGMEDYVVVGTLAYREEHDTWSLHVLDAGATTRFLEVQSRSGRTHATLLDTVDDAPVHGQLGAGLTYRGRPFHLERRGDARVSPSGETGTRVQPALLRYARYSGAGGGLLLVESEGSIRRAFYGEALALPTLQIFPHA